MNIASIFKQLSALTRVRGLCLLLVSALFSSTLVASPITSERIVNADPLWIGIAEKNTEQTSPGIVNSFH